MEYQISDSSSNEKFDYNGYTVRSKVFSSDAVFSLTFNFVKDELTSVDISDDRKTEHGETYGQVQSFLESRFGKPGVIRKKGDEITNKWNFDGVKITHSVQKAFALNEYLQILPPKKSKIVPCEKKVNRAEVEEFEETVLSQKVLN